MKSLTKTHRKHLLCALAVATMSLPALAYGTTTEDLFELSIEQLVQLEVTSVSGKSERLVDTTSAVFVITQDDLKRHGIRSIPEALRLAPGLNVAQIDGNKWAIGSRGFTGRFANKLLVLMDGRLLYTPSFSGVFWDVQHVLIEEIERIEVIRGPGAVIWGTNAVNGVINIITRRSDEDPGTQLYGGTSPLQTSFAAARNAGRLSENSSYRAYIEVRDGDNNQLTDGSDADDDWNLTRAGWRSDSNFDQWDFTLIGEAYTGDMGISEARFSATAPNFQVVQPDSTDVGGGFLLGQWNVPNAQGANTSGQVYLDYTDRESRLYHEQRSTISADFQHQRQFDRHDLIVGGLARYNSIELSGSEIVTVSAPVKRNYVVNLFAQDDIQITDQFSVTLGIKLEGNSLSPKSVETMPTIRALWQPNENHTVWAAITRSIRSPSFADTSVRVLDVFRTLEPGHSENPFPLPLRTQVSGSPDFVSEVNISYELGFRGKLSESLTYDAALYSMEYNNLRSFTNSDVRCSPSGVSVLLDPSCLLMSDSLIADLVFANKYSAQVRGAELALDWQLGSKFRVRSFLAYGDESINTSARDMLSEASYPLWQFGLRTEWHPLESLSISTSTRYVDDVPLSQVDDYWQANVSARWEINRKWSASTGIHNLLRDSTIEARSELNDTPIVAIERSAFLNLSYSF